MNRAELTDDQRHGIEEALRWETKALAELGAAELARQAAEAEVARLAERVNNAASRARAASNQCANVLRIIAGMLELPPGEWVYDGRNLVLKEKRDA